MHQEEIFFVGSRFKESGDDISDIGSPLSMQASSVCCGLLVPTLQKAAIDINKNTV